MGGIAWKECHNKPNKKHCVNVILFKVFCAFLNNLTYSMHLDLQTFRLNAKISNVWEQVCNMQQFTLSHKRSMRLVNIGAEYRFSNY